MAKIYPINNKVFKRDFPFKITELYANMLFFIYSFILIVSAIDYSKDKKVQLLIISLRCTVKISDNSFVKPN